VRFYSSLFHTPRTFLFTHLHTALENATRFFLFQTSKEAQERKNTSLDASSEGASDGPAKETSKEAKLHGLGSVLFNASLEF
jgi:hypothetical protein